MKTTSSKLAVLAGILLYLPGCHGHDSQGHGSHGHGADHGDDEGHAAPQDPAHTEHGASHASPVGGLQLALDDGKKWQVDESTRESATRLAALVDGAQTLGTVEDARALGQALDQELDTLVKGCKMTGPAHDQLHVFLLALFPRVEALEEKTELAGLQLARTEIGELLEAYETHFE